MSNSTILQKVSMYSSSYNLQTNIESHNVNYNLTISHPEISYSKEISLPLSVLQNNSSLEAIVFYLKDILGLRFNEIARLLNRNQKTIWVTYSNAKKKKISLDLRNNSGLMLPLSIFISRNFSILETIVFHLRINQLLSFNEIAKLLGKNYRTIWTVYKRSLKKLEHEK